MTEWPTCPIGGYDTFSIEEQDDNLASFLGIQATCQRCEIACTLIYHFARTQEVEIWHPYGPEYLTRDVQHALMAWEGHLSEESIRSNGTFFAVGYEPWMRLHGYGHPRGWFDCTQDMPEILAREGA